jgi:signal transduction histidine kinase
MILFRNWTHNFKYQFAKAESQLQEMITATVSHEMRTPINAILIQLDSLDMILGETHKGAQKMTRIIKNSS